MGVLHSWGLGEQVQWKDGARRIEGCKIKHYLLKNNLHSLELTFQQSFEKNVILFGCYNDIVKQIIILIN